MNAQTSGIVRITNNVTQKSKQGLLPLYPADFEQMGTCLTGGVDKFKCEALGQRIEKNSKEAKVCESKFVLTHRNKKTGKSLCTAWSSGFADQGESCFIQKNGSLGLGRWFAMVAAYNSSP